MGKKLVPKVIQCEDSLYIGFTNPMANDDTPPKEYCNFMGVRYHFTAVEPYNEEDVIFDMSPTLYFNLSHNFKKNKKKYNLKKYKHELNQ